MVKTTLLRFFVERAAERGATVVWSPAFGRPGAPPYWLWARRGIRTAPSTRRPGLPIAPRSSIGSRRRCGRSALPERLASFATTWLVRTALLCPCCRRCSALLDDAIGWSAAPLSQPVTGHRAPPPSHASSYPCGQPPVAETVPGVAGSHDRWRSPSHDRLRNGHGPGSGPGLGLLPGSPRPRSAVAERSPWAGWAPAARRRDVTRTQRRSTAGHIRLVASVAEVVAAFRQTGGRTLSEPEEVSVGWLAVVADPFGNSLVLIDLSKARYATDDVGQLTGIEADPTNNAR